MPSKTRAARASKASKENIGAVKTTKTKASSNVLKGARKPLSDKTNSASDDNASVLSDKTKKPVATVSDKHLNNVCEDDLYRPRRARRLPTRYKENNTLKSLSNSLDVCQESPPLKTLPAVQKKATFVNKAAATQNPDSKATVLAKKKTSPVKKVQVTKTPVKTLDLSLVKNRPKRICRLPNKFVDHSISPNKDIPLQPINASTPLVRKTKKVNKKEGEHSLNISPVLPKEVSRQKAVNDGDKQRILASTNNNGKKNKQQISPTKSPGTPGRIFTSRTTEKVSNKNTSVRLLDDNKNNRKRNSSKLDVYEFTFDPDEEPRPAKKKKKKPAPRKPKPKSVPRVKSNYDKNLAKALAALKNAVSSKSITNTVKQNENIITNKENVNNVVNNCISTPAHENNVNLVIEQSIVSEKNYNSVRVEDIARDFQINEDDHALDYSPVNSPSRPKTPADEFQCNTQKVQTPNNADPLNLRNDLSFFDEVPVASSSMNISARHPQASPWRAEFGNLPIKWQVNTYVKANMTPAYESSFLNFNDSKKKHVYTNMGTEANDSLPQVDNTSNLKQTSIMSFIKEVVDRNANKKNKKSTPIKSNSLFEDLTSTSVVNHTSPTEQTPVKNNANVPVTPESGEQYDNNISDLSNEKEHSVDKENSTENVRTPKEKNNTYFGFDDIEDQENVSPVKKNNRARSLRSRTRGILQEINEHKGPTRVILPVAAKPKLIQNILNRNEIKTATEPPVFPEVAVDGNTDIMTNVEETYTPESLENDDQSVHLFEDIDMLMIHHPKPIRKSYGKAKKVTFKNHHHQPTHKPVASNDDSSASDVEGYAAFSSDEENLEDLSFKLPSERPKKTIKKRKPKKQLSKKEEKEVEAWAAGFNSMCEDIDGFDLVVE